MNNNALIDLSTTFLNNEMYSPEFTNTYWLMRHPDWQSPIAESSKKMATDGILNTGITDFDSPQVDETLNSLNSYVSVAKEQLDNSDQEHDSADEFLGWLRHKFCPRFPIC